MCNQDHLNGPLGSDKGVARKMILNYLAFFSDFVKDSSVALTDNLKGG